MIKNEQSYSLTTILKFPYQIKISFYQVFLPIFLEKYAIIRILNKVFFDIKIFCSPKYVSYSLIKINMINFA